MYKHKPWTPQDIDPTLPILEIYCDEDIWIPIRPGGPHYYVLVNHTKTCKQNPGCWCGGRSYPGRELEMEEYYQKLRDILNERKTKEEQLTPPTGGVSPILTDWKLLSTLSNQFKRFIDYILSLYDPHFRSPFK